MTDLSGKVVIVVPCFNEARRLDVSAFRAFASTQPKLEFLFVNDGSTDDTQQVLERLRVSAPQSFATLHLPRNCGKAEAVRRGMLQAFATDADYVGFWDADLATPLDMIDPLCAILDRRPDIEMVFGARLPLLGRAIRRAVLRGWLGRLFALVTSLLLGFRVRDTQCGAKLFRSSPITRSAFQQPFVSRWIFDVEIVSRLVNVQRHSDLLPVTQTIYEFPLDQWREVAGGTIKSRDFLRAISELAAIYWQYLRPGASVYAVDDETGSSQAYDPPSILPMPVRDSRHARAA
jgi:dolichyl-phosphate beta-glucosyltransferase